MSQVVGTDLVKSDSSLQDGFVPHQYRWLWAPLVFALLTLAMFAGVLLSSQRVVSSAGTDISSQFLAWREFGFTELRHGNLALWNPHVFAGAPYFGGFQSALLYPLNWLHLFLSVPLAINWIVALHVFLAGYFTYLWCRGSGAGIGGSILAGIMFMFSGVYFFHIYAGHLPNLSAMIWAPLMLLTIDKLSQTGSLKWCVLGIFATTMQILAGHPQYVYYTGIVLTVYTTLRTNRWQVPAGFVAMYLGAIVIAAVQLFAGLQAASECARSAGTGYAFASTFSFPPAHFLTWFAPTVFGNVWLGTDSTQLYYWSNGYLWELSLFVSVSGLTLAVLGAVAGRVSKMWTILTMVVFCFALALGRYTFLYRPMFDWVPEYGKFRGTAKFDYIGELFICFLASVGFDALLRERRVSFVFLRNTAIAAIAMFVLGGLIAASGSKGPYGNWGQFVSSTIDAAVAAQEEFNTSLAEAKASAPFIAATASQAAGALYLGGATLGVVVFLLWASRFKRWMPYSLIVLATVELFCFASTVRQTFHPAAEKALPAPWREPIAALDKNQRVLILGPRPVAGMSVDMDLLTGADPFVLKRYAELAYVSQGFSPAIASQYLPFRQIHAPIFQMLRCGLFCDAVDQPPLVAPHADPVFFEPLPVAKLTSNWSAFATSEQMLSYMAKGPFDPTSQILLEQSPEVSIAPENASPGTVGVVKQTTDALEIDADVQLPTMLLVTNNYSTGWRIRPIESPQQHFEIMPANYCQIGIPLIAGKHHFILEYSPLAFRVGRWISIVGLLGYVGWIAVLLRQARVRRAARI